MLMFVVKWIVRYKEKSPVETENSLLNGVDAVVGDCQKRLYDMRGKHVASPPDGFRQSGQRLRRWLGPQPTEDQDF
jgi:hypothetical protein